MGTALIVCADVFGDLKIYDSEALARALMLLFFFLSVHLGVLPPQYQKAGYASVDRVFVLTW